ncbi:uncharacterized protein LOC126812560 [Patella vulgata]|uniref:uncharacterized protein LOC126812560 n=1 Tax=Patella vulgata TaxID=6465 RepID=UPI0021802DE5|nr:uncharacterized protein LOC126812560 [Patella vulgata]
MFRELRTQPGINNIGLMLNLFLAHVQLSGGMEIGYGGNVCYLSSKQLVGYCFVLPLCLVIILNVVFFFWTIISISRVKQQGKQFGERNNIL